jgi:hypothetical protein
VAGTAVGGIAARRDRRSPAVDALSDVDALPGVEAFPGVKAFPGVEALRGIDAFPGVNGASAAGGARRVDNDVASAGGKAGNATRPMPPGFTTTPSPVVVAGTVVRRTWVIGALAAGRVTAAGRAAWRELSRPTDHLLRDGIAAPNPEPERVEEPGPAPARVPN